MARDHKHIAFSGRMIIVGFGSIGQGVLPLVLRHIAMKPEQIVVITAHDMGRKEAESMGVKFLKKPLTRENYRKILEPMLGKGDFLMNVSVNVASIDLVELCREKGALYLDTCIEPWPGAYTDPRLSPSARSNYKLREDALVLRNKYSDGPTAVLTHGANPGLVSHFVKEALLNIAKAVKHNTDKPKSRTDWAELSRSLGVKVIHIAERDTQVSTVPKKVGEFVNTWSIEGFVSEGMQPAELGWGSHELNFPTDGGRHDFGCGAAIYLTRPGAGTRMRSWTPLEGPYHGFLVTHSESISIADYLTLAANGKPAYRPTVHYVYHPCDAAVLSLHEMAGKNWHAQTTHRLIMDDIAPGGIDELGVLLMGHKKGAYWFGSRLSIDEARRVVPYNNATSLQVTAACLAGAIWAMENPDSFVIEPDEMNHERILEIARPYLGDMVGEFSDWTPLHDRHRLFREDVDNRDPWQFKNFRVS
ncbi:MAG TPA: saccharopine dehydrogenase C-terminal domain-containing protein [Stellaceae bacterium]|nr:saccharopine dehydrogenase C-terminal domain-containing protein [Stellaceae bacterium]